MNTSNTLMSSEKKGEKENREVVKLTGNQMEIFQHWQIRRNAILMPVLLASSALCYYEIIYQLKNLPGSIIVNTISAQMSDFIAVILGGLVFNRFGPKMTFVVMYSFIAVGSLFLVKYWHDLSMVPVFIFVAQFGASANLNNICTASV